jgi:8-amino-7-oxononanoate synthase
MSLLEHYAAQLDQLKQQGNYRQFTENRQHGQYIEIAGQQMLNLSSNDYLGLAAEVNLREQFFAQYPVAECYLSSSSSRLLTGNFLNMPTWSKVFRKRLLGVRRYCSIVAIT